MFFYRSSASQAGVGPSLATIRTLATVSMAAYPAGALILALGGDGGGGLYAHEIAGLALIAATPVLGSPLQRIVGDQARELDERELQLRQRATSWAYFAFTAIVALALFDAGVASDTGMWLPSSFDQWSGIFWGVLLYSALLPTAFLAWTLPGEAEE